VIKRQLFSSERLWWLKSTYKHCLCCSKWRNQQENVTSTGSNEWNSICFRRPDWIWSRSWIDWIEICRVASFCEWFFHIYRRYWLMFIDLIAWIHSIALSTVAKNRFPKWRPPTRRRLAANINWSKLSFLFILSVLKRIQIYLKLQTWLMLSTVAGEHVQVIWDTQKNCRNRLKKIWEPLGKRCSYTFSKTVAGTELKSRTGWECLQ
jgi:hypothetical protein